MHVLHVVGARPNLMKAAPVLRALKEHSKVKQTLVHTGQHYDANMSEVFFQQLGIPAPGVAEVAPRRDGPAAARPAVSGRAVSGRAVSGRAVSGRALSGRR